MKTKKLETWLMRYLRKAYFYWPSRRQALRRAELRKENKKPIYQCGQCRGEFLKVHVDHKRPVIPIKGFDTWDKVINRLFCPPSGLQILCKDCHREKTNRENQKRRKYR